MNVMYLGMKHREERVVGGEVKPTSSMFGEEGKKIHKCSTTRLVYLSLRNHYYYVIIYNDRGLLVNKYPWWRTVWP